jgi:hypothetical protein
VVAGVELGLTLVLAVAVELVVTELMSQVKQVAVVLLLNLPFQ